MPTKKPAKKAAKKSAPKTTARKPAEKRQTKAELAKTKKTPVRQKLATGDVPLLPGEKVDLKKKRTSSSQDACGSHDRDGPCYGNGPVATSIVETPKVLTPEELPVPPEQPASRPITSGNVNGTSEPQILDSLGSAAGRADPYAPPPVIGKPVGEAVNLSGKDQGEEEE